MELDELRSNLLGGTMVSPAAILCYLRALTAEQGTGQPPTPRHQPTHWFTPISASISHIKGGLAAAARPLLLLLLLSQEHAGSELLSGKHQERVGFGGGLLPFGSIQGFGVTSAAAAGSEKDLLLLQQYRNPSGASASHAAPGGLSLPPSGASVRSRETTPSSDARARLPPVSDLQVGLSELPAAQSSAAKGASRRLYPPAGEKAAPEAVRDTGKETQNRALVAGGDKAEQSREDAAGILQRNGGIADEPPSRDTKTVTTPTSRDAGPAGTGRSRGSERSTIGTWDSSPVPFRKTSRATNGKYPRMLDRRFSKLPPPLPESRVLPALRSFEDVHGQLTLFFNGFSRAGSVVAYDLLNELRTVSEAKMMMDVEFLVLDRVMEYYGTPTHMRVVDTTVVHELLDLSNLLPWRIPHLVSSIRKLAVEYQPVLREFLDRYEPIIEALVLVKVPSGLKPLRPLLARLFNIPKEKLVLASDLKDLRDHIPLKYIPREFGNASGSSVRDGPENRMSWKIMLEEIAEKLGEDALSPAGKVLLKEFREERRRTTAAAGISKTTTSDRKPNTDRSQSIRMPPPPAPVTEVISEYDAEGVTEDERSDEVLEGEEDTWEKTDIALRRRGKEYQRTSGLDHNDSGGLGAVAALEDLSEEGSNFAV